MRVCKATWRSRTAARCQRGKVWRQHGCRFGTRRAGLLHKHGIGGPMAQLQRVHRRRSHSSAAHGIGEGLSRRGSPFGLGRRRREAAARRCRGDATPCRTALSRRRRGTAKAWLRHSLEQVAGARSSSSASTSSSSLGSFLLPGRSAGVVGGRWRSGTCGVV